MEPSAGLVAAQTGTRLPMRIIAGTLKRRPIAVPGGEAVRPTTDRTREAAFSLVGSRIDLDGVDVLDLFAGSGALGLEAISRGARSALFVERDRHAIRALRENLRRLGVEDMGTVVQADAQAWLARFNGPGFHLILADPPYDLPDIARLPERAIRLLHPDGLFLLEHDRRHRFDATAGLILSRAYGRSTLSLFRRTATP